MLAYINVCIYSNDTAGQNFGSRLAPTLPRPTLTRMVRPCADRRFYHRFAKEVVVVQGTYLLAFRKGVVTGYDTL